MAEKYENKKCCNCGKRHKTWDKLHNCIGSIVRRSKEQRDRYDAIYQWVHHPGNTRSSLDAATVIGLFRDCLDSEYVDFDGKGRGSALNHDLYGYDPAQGVAVIQARQAYRRRKNHYMSTRKTYFLCGFNEITNSPFRHPISAAAIRGAIRAGADAVGVVKAAQRWMWEVTEKQLNASVRQGDLLLVPERGEPQGEYMGQVMTMAGSHVIHAREIRRNGRIYALNPQLIHAKGQHAPVALNGWTSVRVAKEVEAWNFAVRIGD